MSLKKIAIYIPIVYIIAQIFCINTWGLTETSEARYAEISREMYIHHDYLKPTMLGIYHFHKPPVTYYITSLGYWLFGINEFGARFFLVISIALQFILIIAISKQLQLKQNGLTNVLVYASFPVVIAASLNLTTDSYLTTFIMCSVYFWLRYIKYQKYHTLFLYLYYIMLGIIVETKGPVGLLFVFTFIVSYRIFFKKAFQFSIHHFIGLCVFLCIGMLWYLLLFQELPELLNYFIHDQLVDRMVKKSFNRAKPFWYYLVILLGILLFWIPTLIHKKKNIQTDRTKWFLLTNILSMLILFSVFKTKLIFYILPIFYLIAMYIGIVIQEVKTYKLRLVSSIVLLLTIVFIASIYVLYFIGYQKISVTGTILALSTLLFVLLIFIYIKKLNWQQKTPILAGCFILGLSCIGSFFMAANTNAIHSTKDMCVFINSQKTSKHPEIYVYNDVLNGIPFYTNCRVTTINNGKNTADREIQFQDTKEYKAYLFDVTSESDINRLKQKPFGSSTFFIKSAKSTLPNHFNTIIKQYQHSKIFGKWIVYY